MRADIAVVNRKVLDLEKRHQLVDEMSKQMDKLRNQLDEMSKRMYNISDLVQVHNKILYDDGGDAS